ncbi:MAG: NUDIX domain-containing protein [Deltaproteobacteria bacterium]|nr:NUDIX domain-containing protein [Deltaproteobacteria bacterium]
MSGRPCSTPRGRDPPGPGAVSWPSEAPACPFRSLEFPGGKVAPRESLEEGLIRELREEPGVAIEGRRPARSRRVARGRARGRARRGTRRRSSPASLSLRECAQLRDRGPRDRAA